MSAMNDELKPCPFCGAPPKLTYQRNTDENWIACENDDCDVAPTACGPGIAQVTDSWNRRAVLPEARRKLSDLVPTSWLDPLLSGPGAALPAIGDIEPKHIEAMLRRLKARIEEA